MRKYSIHAILFNRSAAFIVAAIVACIGLLSSTLSEAQPATDSAPLFNEGFKTSTPIKLDHDVVIKSDARIYSVDGNGHTITVYPGVLIRATRPTLELKNVTFIVNDYGNKNGFKENRQLIVSSAKKVHISDVTVKTGKEYEKLLLPDGSGYRGRDFIRIIGAESVVFSKVRSYNIRTLAVYNNCKNAIVKDVVSYNCETNQHAKTGCDKFTFDHIAIYNNVRDKGWVVGGKNGMGTNGKDVVLNGASNAIIRNIVGVNCIERAVYSMASNVDARDLYAENCGGFKFVGESRDRITHNVYVSGCVWKRTADLESVFRTLKKNCSDKSQVVASESNLDIYAVYYADKVSINDLKAYDYTGKDYASVGLIHNCDGLSLSHWTLENIHCSRPLVYVTRNSDGQKPINIYLKDIKLVDYAHRSLKGEAVVVGSRMDVDKCDVYVTAENLDVRNSAGLKSFNYLFGRGVSNAVLKNSIISGALDNCSVCPRVSEARVENSTLDIKDKDELKFSGKSVTFVNSKVKSSGKEVKLKLKTTTHKQTLNVR